MADLVAFVSTEEAGLSGRFLMRVFPNVGNRPQRDDLYRFSCEPEVWGKIYYAHDQGAKKIIRAHISLAEFAALYHHPYWTHVL